MTTFSKALFIALLVISTLIEWTYNFGVAARPYIIKAAAVTYVIALYAVEAAQYVYANRDVIRHRIESLFVYDYEQPTYSLV